ncbi:hypothetical protein MMC28_005392 [Mycoblastus sanguinarius]|nr:hypothetical protein [Mycoblastus sanguinarius]
MAPITINENTIDPSLTKPEYFPKDALETNFIILQCHQQLVPGNFSELAESSVEIQSIVGEATYLCKYKPIDLSVLEKLPYVKHAITYHENFVRRSSLQDSAAAKDPSKTLPITIQLHQGTPETEACPSSRYWKPLGRDRRPNLYTQ